MLKPICISGSLFVLITMILVLSPEAQLRPAAPHAQPGPLFQTSDNCMACHNGLSTPSGEDISIGFDWRPSMMANSARDPYWQAGVRRETLDHPQARAAIEHECSICHMPMATYQAKVEGGEGEVFAHLPFNSSKPASRLAADGVSCTTCHQIENEKLGTRESFVGGFVVDASRSKGERPVYGPFKIDAGRTRIMRSATGFRPTEAPHLQQSEICATCHTLYTKALGPDGQILGELPEQMPYQEWLHSAYREERSCQACHMPLVEGKVPITGVLGEPRENVRRHVFVGANFFMQRMLNRYRNELSVAALPQELEAAALRTVAHLQTESARVSIGRLELRQGRLEAEISIQNLGGHKLPTAYPSRRVWLHVVVRERSGRVLFESGKLDPRGLIEGNDNDADPARYEPHYTEITSSDQVQVYEAIMTGQNGALTTGLLTAVRFVKDNRLLPRGFEKTTAHEDIAVRGGAFNDGDFVASGDKIRYSVDVSSGEGPFQMEAELWYQPVSFRWAANLRQYNAVETSRFTAYYDSMAPASGVILASAAATN
ncbi:MAG TPA: hypothetical protein VIC04_09890 [Terriglobia bacterium]